MEVVSGDPKDRKRDYEDKLIDYAAANVAEYWIVDPELRIVIVHGLDGMVSPSRASTAWANMRRHHCCPDLQSM